MLKIAAAYINSPRPQVVFNRVEHCCARLRKSDDSTNSKMIGETIMFLDHGGGRRTCLSVDYTGQYGGLVDV